MQLHEPAITPRPPTLNEALFPTSTLPPGTVVRLNLDAGIGDVRAAEGGTLVFVAGLVTHRVMQQLRVGQVVRFELDDRGRVIGLVPAQELSPTVEPCGAELPCPPRCVATALPAHRPGRRQPAATAPCAWPLTLSA